jgi:hypothetical protein
MRLLEGRDSFAFTGPVHGFMLGFTFQLFDHRFATTSATMAWVSHVLKTIPTIIMSADETVLPLMHHVLDDIFPNRFYSCLPRMTCPSLAGDSGLILLFHRLTLGRLPLLSSLGVATVATVATTRMVVSRVIICLFRQSAPSACQSWRPRERLGEVESEVLGTIIAYSYALLTPLEEPIAAFVYGTVVDRAMCPVVADWEEIGEVNREMTNAGMARLVGERASVTFARHFSTRALTSP